MNLSVQDNGIAVDMIAYLEKVVSGKTSKKEHAEDTQLEMNEDSPALSAEETADNIDTRGSCFYDVLTIQF